MLTLETILDRNNLNRAYKAVVANKGSAGVDGMEVGDLLGHLKTHGAALVQSITEGQYRPSPVRRVLIPKENGQTRPLGIPTVVDRMVQQAVAQMLVEEYESVFSDGSHGFRPGRSCSTAMDQALRYANEGYKWVVDLGKLFKNPRAKPDGTKMFCSAFLNDARMCCFFANAIVKY